MPHFYDQEPSIKDPVGVRGSISDYMSKLRGDLKGMQRGSHRLHQSYRCQRRLVARARRHGGLAPSVAAKGCPNVYPVRDKPRPETMRQALTAGVASLVATGSGVLGKVLGR
jgi:hypothetical protein